jgi:hypothetical protein
MTDELYQCTARRLATPHPEAVDLSDTVAEAREWFQQKGYDFAPVLETGNPVGYVGVERLAEADDDKPVKRVLKNIQLQHIISSDATFDDILTGLEEQFFYFLGGKNQVTGILIRADVNTSPAQIHLFDRISLVERELRNLIDDVAPDWKADVYFPEDVEKEIDKRHTKAKEANVELSKIHYAGFSALENIVTEYEECWRACGYNKDHKAGSDLDKIRKLRNDVAHSNLILQTTSDEYRTQGRSIRDLIKIYEALTNCNRSLLNRSE